MVRLQVETKYLIPFNKLRVTDPVNTVLELTRGELGDTLFHLESSKIPYKILPIKSKRIIQ